VSNLFLKSIRGQSGYTPPAPPPEAFDEKKRKSTISEKYIGIILRHRRRGLSYMEIAKDLALPYHTVYNVVRRNLEQ
jgi:DNA-directed RNA polymerase specialized sigma24 family protein